MKIPLMNTTRITMKQTLSWLSLMSMALLTGCSHLTSEHQLERQGPTMSAVYQQSMGQSDAKQLKAIRAWMQGKNAPLKGLMKQKHRIQPPTAEFRRLPNPTIQMYVYPHLTGRDEASKSPVPAYRTSLPLYQSEHYAASGEPTTNEG